MGGTNGNGARRWLRACKIGLGAGVLVALLAGADPGSASNDGDKATLQHLRQLSGRFHSEAEAAAAGYQATDECVAVPGLGGMGYHYVNVGLLDRTLDAEHPEAVLYASKPGGGRELTAVEYVVVDADQNLATSGDRPTLAGHAFDGPMPGHAPGMPIHYDLHVWVWQDNPAGAFATWNPAITCP